MLLNTLFPNTHNLCSSLSVKDQILHLYKTTGKVKVPYILIFKFLERRWEAKDLELNGSKHSPNYMLLIYSWMQF
jgi:hypothetical protein